MKRNKGFTLIELLVVIAIIGILSAIVLASLNSARTKATDAKTQGQMASIRAAAEIAYNGSNYGTASATANDCGTLASNPALTNLMLGSNWPDGNPPVCASGAAANSAITSWAMSHGLNTSGTYWCVDSTGASISTTTAVTIAAHKNCAGVAL